MIILEGMDGSGKSTLGKELSQEFNLLLVHPGAPPKDPHVENHMMNLQRADMHRHMIYDRVTCISQQVYRKRMFDMWYDLNRRTFSENPNVLIIYCRPPDEILLDPTHHKPAPHDTPEMLKLVNDNLNLFVRSYDILMSKTNHLKYNYTNEADLANVKIAVKNYLEKSHGICKQ